MKTYVPTYTDFIVNLINIILSDNKDMTAHDIALTESDCKEAFEKGISADHLYYEIWQQDAGNYYAM